MRRSSPRRLTNALCDLTDELMPASPLGRIQRAWPSVVGAAIAAEASPTAEHGGVLTVSCSAAVWAAELEMMGSEIVDALNTALEGSPAIEALRCRTA